MSNSKQTVEKWRSEDLRDKRKARLASMKSRDGGKKPVKTSNKLATLITVLVIIVALIGTGIWWVFNIGLPQRTVTALTVGNEKYSAAFFNYFYYSQLSYYSIDPTTTAGKQTLASAYDETYPTVADYLKDLAAKDIQNISAVAQAATAAGVALESSDMDTVDYYITNFENQAKSAGKDSLENYLIATYGKGMNEAIMRQIIELYLLSDKYTTQLEDSYEITDADIQSYYNDNKDDFDVVNYRTFYIASVTESGATDDEKKAAMAAAKTKADEMLSKISSEEDFKAMCIEYAADDTEKTKYTDSDASLVENKAKSSLYNEDQSAWLFDTKRVASDKTVIESTSGYYVMYFINRHINNIRHVSVRHILITAARDTATEEQIAAAKTKAESILAEYEAGEKTDAAFAALATANTEDTASAPTGGLYTDISPSSSYVEEFLNWAVDDTRKAGDTGIVQTDYGFHIMYFVGVDNVEWKINVKSTLVSNMYNEWLDKELEAKPYKLDSFGMRFVG